MPTEPTTTAAFLQDLGDGLILRRATTADIDKLAEFNLEIHDRSFVDTGGQPRVSIWTRDLLLDTHPTFRPGDFTVVEDTRSHKIVSSCNLISQVWTYEGIPFKVGRPELVGTDPAYRNRGLVRKQFEILHQWSEERGEMVQGITGIPYYYRQYGYEMAVNLTGSRDFFVPQQIPKLKEGQSEPFLVRPATEADIPLLVKLFGQANRRFLLASQWDEELIRYEISGKLPENVNRSVLEMITRPDGEPIGFFARPDYLWTKEKLATYFLEILPGISWYDVAPVVLRALAAEGQRLAVQEKKDSLQAVTLSLGTSHPAYNVLSYLNNADFEPYSWYLRVPDLPRFIRHVAPAIEKRLAESDCAGWTGSLKFTFYRSNLELAFEQGKLVKVEPIDLYYDFANAAFPGTTFLQILFGYRTLAELNYAFPDAWSDRDIRPIINALFPKKPSWILPIS